MSIKAKVLKYEQDYGFGGQGHSKLIFNVKDVFPEIEDIIKKENFIKSNKSEIKYVNRYGPEFGYRVRYIKTVNDQEFNEHFGLKDCYYLDLADTASMGFNIIIYNQNTKILYFLNRKY